MIRVRSSVDYNQYGTVTNYSNGAVTGNTGTAVNLVSRSMTDTNTPYYGQRIRAGEYIVNPCSLHVESTTTEGLGYYRAVHKTTGAVLEAYGDGCLSRYAFQTFAASQKPVLPSLPVGWGSSAIDQAQANALADIDSTPYSFGEDLAEWRETLAFLRDPLGSLKKLSSLYQRDVSKLIAKKKHLHRAKAMADVYLTYRFAFSPLVRSMTDLIAAYASTPSRPERRSARGFSKAQHSEFKNHTLGTATNRLYWSTSRQSTMKVHAVIGYEVANPVMDWRFKYGLRFKDIPATLWAVFPMSFMYDRVFNLSVAIRGITNLADPNVTFLGGSVVQKVDHDVSYSWLRQAHTSYNSTVSPDVARSKTFDYTRTVWSPTVLDAIPPFTVGNLYDSTTKVADILALITQRLKVK